VDNIDTGENIRVTTEISVQKMMIILRSVGFLMGNSITCVVNDEKEFLDKFEPDSKKMYVYLFVCFCLSFS
jgi:hypothetical protein